MTKSSLTYEMVRAAMTELKTSDIEPSSVRQVRSITKTGSNDTVKKLIMQVKEDWQAEDEARERQRVADLREQYPLPESIAEFVASISTELNKLPLMYAESAACAHATRIREQERWQSALAIEHQKGLSKLKAEYEERVEALTNELAGKDQNVSELRTANKHLDSELHKCLAGATMAEDKLTSAEKRIAQLTAAIAKNEETQQTLRQLLDLAKNLPPQPEEKLAAAE